MIIARLPTMVNISSGATNHSPRKRLVSSSPKRPVGYRTNPSQRHSPTMNAVQKVVLGEKDDSGENPANYRNNQNWYDGGKKQAVGEGTVNERGHPSPADDRKKQTSKAKTQVSTNTIYVSVKKSIIGLFLFRVSRKE